MTELIDKIVNEKKALFYPLQPDAYHCIDEDANIRIDFIDELQPGINFNVTKEKLNNEFSILGGIRPFYYEARLLNKTFKNHNFDVMIANNQNLELNYIMKPIRGIGAQFTLQSPTLHLKQLSEIATTASITHQSKRSTLEAKGTTSSKHRVLGISYNHAVNHYLTLGGEAYYKFIQKSGGGSFGARYRNEFGGFQYSITSVYSVLGDFKVSTSVSLIPKFLTLSTRFKLNTSDHQSKTQVGARIITKPIINGYKVPICIKLRTDNNFQNAISIEVNTPAVAINLSTFGHKLNLLNNIGISFEI